MKANLEINFLKINNIPVNKELLDKTINLKGVTEKMLDILSNDLEKYFSKKKIQTKITYKLT